MAIIYRTATAPSKALTSTFLEVLEEWGSTWMWKSMQLVGSDDWLVKSIERGILRAVTDGSYIK